MAEVPCYISSLLIMPVLGSLGSKWIACFAVFLILIMPDLGSSVSEQLWCLTTIFMAFSQCMSLALQKVSGFGAFLCS